MKLRPIKHVEDYKNLTVVRGVLVLMNKQFCYGCNEYVDTGEIEEYEHKGCLGDKELGVCYDAASMPILIREKDEELEDGDYVYHKGLNIIGSVTYCNHRENQLHLDEGGVVKYTDCKKVLVHNGYFSLEDRKKIITKKLRDGDELFAVCTRENGIGRHVTYYLDVSNGNAQILPIPKELEESIPFKAGDTRLLLNGQPIGVDFRLIREDKYQELLVVKDIPFK